MSVVFDIHPDNPQQRLIYQAALLIKEGGLVAVPTDSGYAVVARLDDADAAKNLRRIRGLDDRHLLTILCRDLAEIAHFARVDNQQYRLLKLATPGPWTFILEASKEVPRRVSHPSRKTIGIRVPQHTVLSALIEEVGSPLLSTTFIPEGEDMPFVDYEDFVDDYKGQLEGIIVAGDVSAHPTTIIDLSGSSPEVLRVGAGNPEKLGIFS
ncbi:L-threonylcarbamoyladenylate synthase [Pelistega suis]|uniref:Threonylcarbamoyl-AMP synthase n=1 Tax=Pelistega suis TaxID=1631957 RepID=A0A849P8D6_9BURK|nr:L-threonylcarbamoyladenylate synthase [Pelistega suis]MCQ9328402.1 L-threonylcarbamoyladenylate synthase [Pelistega suis]NOL51798.1 threonylcarbamoyl-AMP synthase [Pelistega suis]